MVWLIKWEKFIDFLNVYSDGSSLKDELKISDNVHLMKHVRILDFNDSGDFYILIPDGLSCDAHEVRVLILYESSLRIEIKRRINLLVDLFHNFSVRGYFRK